MTALPRNIILVGDATRRLAEPPAASIDTVVTSPPYFLLRNYGVEGQLGLEASVEDWVANLVEVFGQVARVLKPAGSLWLNLGDSFSRHRRYGATSKSLLLAPERLLLALSQDGWIVRNKVVWAKPNPTPTSVTDRLNTTYESLYFLVRSGSYFFDLDAIREPHTTRSSRRAQPPAGRPAWSGPLAGKQDGLRRARPAGLPGHPLGKNPGDVWTIPTRPFNGAHFATFPPALVRRPLLATCPERVCTACGMTWRREIHVRHLGVLTRTARSTRSAMQWRSVRHVGDLKRCGCGAPSLPGVVLDPFFGSGTVGVVARSLGRDFVGIELNADFVRLAEHRLTGSSALLKDTG